MYGSHEDDYCYLFVYSFKRGNGNPLQYSCLENPMDGGAWWATVHGVAKSQTRLNDLTFTTFNGETDIGNRLVDMGKGEEITHFSDE